MYPIPVTADGGRASDRPAGRYIQALLQRLGQRLAAAAGAAAERSNPKDNELPREYFRFPPI